MKLRITVRDHARRIILNQAVNAESVNDAREWAELTTPAEHHAAICITDESNPVSAA